MSRNLLKYVTKLAVSGDARSVLQAIDDYSETMGGLIHLAQEKGVLFDEVLQQSAAKRVLELGTNYGYSAIRMAHNLDPSAEILTLEIDPDTAAIARRIIEFAGLEQSIRVICGKARQIIEQEFREPFDLVFIDHYAANYLGDLQLLEKQGLIRTGTIVVSDNAVMFASQLGPYLHHLRDSGLYESSLHQPPRHSDGFEVSRRR